MFPIFRVIHYKGMSTDLTLFGKIISLPPKLKEEVLKYVNYLLLSQEAEIAQVTVKKTPKAGFSSVKFAMSPDFDAPVEDFKA